MSFRFLEKILHLKRTEHIPPQESTRSLIRELVDPDNTLPPVIVRPPDDLNFRQVVLEGRVIGEVVVEGMHTQHFVRVNLSGLREDRPRGAGLATYIYIIEEAIWNDHSFKSDTQVSKDAKRIWEILRDRGVAQVKSEFVEYAPDKFRGDYRVSGKALK